MENLVQIGSGSANFDENYQDGFTSFAKKRKRKFTLYLVEANSIHIKKLKKSWRKNKRVKIEKSVKNLLKEEEIFGIKKFKTYKNFAEKVYGIRSNVIKNLNKLKKDKKKIVGYGAPAKATTALNFFGITDQIDYIIEDNEVSKQRR